MRNCVTLPSTGRRTALVAGGFNRESQVFGRLKTIVRLLFQTALDDARQRQRDVAMRRAEFWRRVIQDRVHALDRRAAPERARATEHLIEHAAEGEDVR